MIKLKKNFYLLSWIILTLPQIALATPKANNQVSLDLETEIWKAKEKHLPDLEKQVIRILQDDPYSTYGHYLLSHLYLEKFSHSPADTQLLRQSVLMAQQINELEPLSELGIIATCEILDARGETTKALALLSQAIGSGIHVSWRSYFMLGKLKTENDSYDTVLDLFKQALSFSESKEEIIIPHIIATLRGKFSDSASDLEKAIMSWNSMFPHILFQETLASVMAENHNWKSANKIYTEIVQKHPERIETRISHAILKVSTKDLLHEGVKDLKQILQLNTDIEDEITFLIKTNLATASLELNRTDEAQKYFVDLLTMTHEEIALTIAQRAYYQHNKIKDFVKLLDHVVQELSGSSSAYAFLGEALSEGLNQPEKAILAFENAISINAQVSNYHTGLGLAHYRKNDYNAALKHFANAVKINPSDSIARYNLACMFSKLGKAQAAISTLQEAFALNPELIEKAHTDPDLQNIHNLQAFQQMIQDVNSIEEDILHETMSH